MRTVGHTDDRSRTTSIVGDDGFARKRETALSAALKSFSEQISPTLLKEDSIGIGPLLPQDVGPMFTWMNDVAANGMDLPHRPTDARTFAASLSALATDSSKVLFVIRRVESAEPVGFVIFQNLHLINRSADLGIRIGNKRDRDCGIGKTAIGLALGYAWNHLNLLRVQLRVMADNHRAVSAYKTCGFQIEGRHVRSTYVSGQWHDMLTMAVFHPSME